MRGVLVKVERESGSDESVVASCSISGGIKYYSLAVGNCTFFSCFFFCTKWLHAGAGNSPILQYT